MNFASRNFFSLFLVFTVVAIAVMPDLAFAAPSFGSGATTMKNDIINMLTPIIGIGIIALGIACAFGKLNWWWFAGAVFGIVLIYGHQQIINWVRQAFGV